MKKSYEECLQQIKSEHKDLYPIFYIEHGGKYIFNMLKRGMDREEAMSNFFIIDSSTGVSMGPIPVMSLYDDDEIADKLANPHKISPEDQQLEHGFLKNDQSSMYRIRMSSPEILEEDDLEYGGYLSHHGIKGQKWGHRNGPPYPLKPEAHSKAEKTVAKSHKSGGESASDPKRKIASIGASDTKKVGLMERMRNKTADANEAWLNELEIDNTKLIDREQTKQGGVDAREAAGYAVAILFNPLNAIDLGVRAGISAYANGKMKSYLKNREKNGKKDPKTGLYLKESNEDSDKEDKKDLAAVNPSVMNMNTNSKNNCMLCTTTYDLRKRGYDVTAQLDSQGYNFHNLRQWYPKAKVERNDRRGSDGHALNQKEYVQKTINNLLKQGDGARGNMMVRFNEGGGHSIVYEVKNGQVIFKDGQVNQVYKNPEKFLNRTSVNAFARLDNIEPDMDQIKKYCVR